MSVSGNGLSHCPFAPSVVPTKIFSNVLPVYDHLEFKPQSTCTCLLLWIPPSPPNLCFFLLSNNYLLLKRALWTPCQVIAHSEGTPVQLPVSLLREKSSIFSFLWESCVPELLFPRIICNLSYPLLCICGTSLVDRHVPYPPFCIGCQRTCHLFSKNSGSSFGAGFRHSWCVSGLLIF